MEASAIILELFLRGAGEALRSDLGRQLFVFFLAWWVVKGTIKTHFMKIESGLDAVAQSVSLLKETMEKIEQSHSVKICRLETGLENVSNKVTILEEKIKNG